jgi:hypothetical protein
VLDVFFLCIKRGLFSAIWSSLSCIPIFIAPGHSLLCACCRWTPTSISTNTL